MMKSDDAKDELSKNNKNIKKIVEVGKILKISFLTSMKCLELVVKNLLMPMFTQ